MKFQVGDLVKTRFFYDFLGAQYPTVGVITNIKQVCLKGIEKNTVIHTVILPNTVRLYLCEREMEKM